MNASARLLIYGGICLAVLGMLYGLHYAVFVEHQTLDRMGGSLTAAFVHAAERNSAASAMALAAYGHTKHDYVRQVDVHSHWVGLAMIMVVLGVVFGRVQFPEAVRFWLAAALLAGSFLFPLGVVLQTVDHGRLPFALAIAGAGLVIASMTGIAWGLAKAR